MPRDITNNLPPAVVRHLTACNGHDIDAWMATFAPDALVNDVQREFAGAEAIRETGLPDPLILSLYFSLRDERITQLIIIHNRALA